MPIAKENIKPEDMELLPTSMRDFARIVGLPAALGLVEKFGGVEFSVPKGKDNNQAGALRFAMLVEVMGEDGADAFVREYGGEKIAIPRCLRVVRRLRDRTIIAEYDSGQSIDALAIAHRLTTRQIEKILKQPITA